MEKQAPASWNDNEATVVGSLIPRDDIVTSEEMIAAGMVRRMEDQAVENFKVAYDRWRKNIRDARFKTLPFGLRCRLTAMGYRV